EETGLGYWGYRWHSTELNRWLSKDPIGEEGGVNLYEFTFNMLGNWVDPLGLQVPKAGDPCDVCCKKCYVDWWEVRPLSSSGYYVRAEADYKLESDPTEADCCGPVNVLWLDCWNIELAGGRLTCHRVDGNPYEVQHRPEPDNPRGMRTVLSAKLLYLSCEEGEYVWRETDESDDIIWQWNGRGLFRPGRWELVQ
ncbi:MAG: RHS repeat-associated core domain-containing protein, partial [Bacteroidota bacterium]